MIFLLDIEALSLGDDVVISAKFKVNYDETKI